LTEKKIEEQPGAGTIAFATGKEKKKEKGIAATASPREEGGSRPLLDEKKGEKFERAGVAVVLGRGNSSH